MELKKACNNRTKAFFATFDEPRSSVHVGNNSVTKLAT
jgi:hypothetical protein